MAPLPSSQSSLRDRPSLLAIHATLRSLHEQHADDISLLHRLITTLLDYYLPGQQSAARLVPSAFPIHSSSPISESQALVNDSLNLPSPLIRRQDLSQLAPRQDQIFAIPLSYDFSGPSPGTVIGIVLGIVGGIILIVILFWAAFSVSPGGDEVVVVETEGSRSDYLRSRRSRRRRSSKYEMRQHRSRSRSHTPPPPPRRARTERIIVQETRRTESRPPPVQINIDRPSSPARSHRVVGDDVVEVIEEQSEISSSVPPPPRRKSKRTSGGSYRVVDPNAYAGGNYAPRDIYDDRRRSKR